MYSGEKECNTPVLLVRASIRICVEQLVAAPPASFARTVGNTTVNKGDSRLLPRAYFLVKETECERENKTPVTARQCVKGRGVRHPVLGGGGEKSSLQGPRGGGDQVREREKGRHGASVLV